MPAISWSNPYAGEAQTPAQMQSRYEVSGGNVSGVLGELMRQRQIEQQQMQQAAQASIKGIADEVQKKKNDQIAQQFLDQASQYDSENPDATAQIARQLNESNSSPSDAWNAFQHYKQTEIKNSLDQSHADYFERYKNLIGPSGEPGKPIIDDKTGMVWNGAHWIKGSTDPWDNAIPVARGKLDAAGNFTNQYTGAEQGDMIKLQLPNKTQITVPYSSYQSRTSAVPDNTAQPAQAQSTAPQVGERRTINGKLAEWDGKGWKAVE